MPFMNLQVEPLRWYNALEPLDRENVYDMLKFFDVALPAYRFPVGFNYPVNARAVVSAVGDSVEKAVGKKETYDKIDIVVARQLIIGGHVRDITLQIMRSLGWGLRKYGSVIYAEKNGHGYRETEDNNRTPNQSLERMAGKLDVINERMRFLLESIAGRAVTDEEREVWSAEFLTTTPADLRTVEAIEGGIEHWDECKDAIDWSEQSIHGWHATLLPGGGSAIDLKAFAGYLSYSRSAEEWLEALETLKRPHVILRDYKEKPGVGLVSM